MFNRKCAIALIIIIVVFSGCIGILEMLDLAYLTQIPNQFNIFGKIEPIELQYPVVLVHGIVANDRDQLPVNFWGRIPERLKEHGIHAYYGNTDAWGTIESNADILNDSIKKILAETGSDKVNIIAHSKGGLDSRYCIWKYNLGDKVASLTTICTPHQGAEIADLIYGQKVIHNPFVVKAIEIFEQSFGDKNPDMINVNYELTTDHLKNLNDLMGMVDERVYFQSLYTTIRNPMDDSMFYYSNIIINEMVGSNDGVVSAESASWGNNFKHIPGSISHVDIIDVKQISINGIDILNIYSNIIKDLQQRGF